MQASRHFHTRLYPARGLAFTALALVVQLTPLEAAVASTAAPLLFSYPHLLYVLLMRSSRVRMTVGVCLMIDSGLITLMVSQGLLPPNMAVLAVLLMFSTVTVCLPVRSFGFAASGLMLSIALLSQRVWLGAMWSNLSVGETIMLVFAVTYLLSLGVLACGWALRLGHRHKDAEAKRYRLLDHHEQVSKFLPDKNLLRDAVDSHLRTHLIVLFSDMCRFTTWSDQLAEIELADWLDTYLNQVNAMVLQEGGLLDKFTGDGLMVIFHAPAEDRLSHMAQALAALRLADRLHHLHRAQGALTADDSLSKANPALLRMPALRIGIHAGHGLFGRFGGQSRSHFTAAGTTINVASRLCTAANAGETLISDRLGQLAGECCSAAVWTPFKPRGLETEMLIARLQPPGAAS